MTAMLVTRMGDPLVAILAGTGLLRSPRGDHLLESVHSRRPPSSYFQKANAGIPQLDDEPARVRVDTSYCDGEQEVGEGGGGVEAEMEERESHEEIEGTEFSDFTTRPLREP